jgi:hypothetical protein
MCAGWCQAVCVVNTECEVDFDEPMHGAPSIVSLPLALGSEVSGIAEQEQFTYHIVKVPCSMSPQFFRVRLTCGGGSSSAAPSGE